MELQTALGQQGLGLLWLLWEAGDTPGHLLAPWNLSSDQRPSPFILSFLSAAEQEEVGQGDRTREGVTRSSRVRTPSGSSWNANSETHRIVTDTSSQCNSGSVQGPWLGVTETVSLSSSGA